MDVGLPKSSAKQKITVPKEEEKESWTDLKPIPDLI